MTDAGAPLRRVTPDNLGAWLLKCNPAVTDLGQLVDEGVRTWCVQSTYRTALIEPGQPVFLWVTGSTGRTPEPGIWATGRTTAATYRRTDGKLVVPLALDFLARPLPRRTIAAHPALTNLEVLRQPMMSNPTFATTTEYHHLRTLLSD